MEERDVLLGAMLVCVLFRPPLPVERLCEDRVLDGPASGEKGSKGRN